MHLSTTIRNAGGELDRRSCPIDADAYGHLFRDLRIDPWQPRTAGNPEDAIYDLSERLYGESDPNPDIPAGYAFFGQLITHDLTFAISPFARATNRRTPRFDLDCVYGGGPEVDPHLFEFRRPNYFVIGRNGSGEPDLPRNGDASLDSDLTGEFDRRRRALIGDPRNDENTILSQMHLALILLHNRYVAEYGFEATRTLVRWAYQHAVIDFLRRICGDVLDEVLLPSGKVELKLFKVDGPGSRIYMPVEFSFAAFRVGHSMIGSSYHLSDDLQREREGHPFDLFADTPTEWSERNKRAHGTLEGQRVLPRKWTIQWDRFLGTGKDVQHSRLIDGTLAPALRRLPLDVPEGSRDERERSLAYRTLIRGWYQQLPSGQKIATLLREKALPDGDDPLWIYLLREAESTHGGLKLGRVGARIVAEVCVGLLCGDESSILYADGAEHDNDRKRWDALRGKLGLTGSAPFTLEHLLRAAGVPFTAAEWSTWGK